MLLLFNMNPPISYVQNKGFEVIVSLTGGCEHEHVLFLLRGLRDAPLDDDRSLALGYHSGVGDHLHMISTL